MNNTIDTIGLHYTKNLSGRNGTTIAYLEAQYLPDVPSSVWRSLTTPGQGDIRVVSGRIEKRASLASLSLEASLLQEYKTRGFSVPSLRSESDQMLVLDYVPGKTFFENIFFDRTLTPASYLAKLCEKYVHSATFDALLPTLLSDGQRSALLRSENEKILALGATPDELEKIPLTAKVRGRYAQLGVSVPPVFAEYLADLERSCASLLAHDKRWFIESSGRNWVEDTRIDLGGVFYGHSDSFLLDTPYLLEDTYWLMRKRHADTFLPQFCDIEKGKAVIISSYATASGRDPALAVAAFQIQRVYRNLLELAYCCSDLERADRAAEQDDYIASVRVIMYASMIFAHQELQNNGLLHTLNHLDAIGSSDASRLRANYAKYDAALDSIVRSVIGRSSLAKNDLFQKYAGAFVSLRQEYAPFGPDSPTSIFTSHEPIIESASL